jgi:hypothetical protein
MQRDLESVAGLRVLAGAVALCGLNSMPEPLARAIFSAEFMGKLDHEMDMCRDGRGYIRQDIKIFGGQCHSLSFFISQIGIETSTGLFTYSNFAWELHGGVDVKWSGDLLVLELH